MATPQKFTRQLKCKLTDDELHAKGAMLAALVRRHDEAKESKKVAMAGYNTSLKELSQAIGKTREARESGVETREVKCEERYTNAGTVEVVRLDTGEVIESRVMTAAERQAELPLDKKPSRTAAKKGKAKGKKTLADALLERLESTKLNNSKLTKSEQACMRRLLKSGKVKRAKEGKLTVWSKA